MIISIVMPAQSSFTRSSNSKISRAHCPFILIDKITGSYHLVFIYARPRYSHCFIKSQCTDAATLPDNSDLFFIFYPTHVIDNRRKIFNSYHWESFLHFIDKVYFFSDASIPWVIHMTWTGCNTTVPWHLRCFFGCSKNIKWLTKWCIPVKNVCKIIYRGYPRHLILRSIIRILADVCFGFYIAGHSIRHK